MKKLFIQWSFQVILILIGLGEAFIPNTTNWTPSTVIWSIASLWLICTLIYWLRHRKEWDDKKKQQHKEWIASKMPYLVDLTDTLAKLHRRTTEISTKLQDRRVSNEVILKCNEDYIKLVQAGFIKKPFAYTKPVNAEDADKLANKVIKKTLKKLQNPIDPQILQIIAQHAEIMENHRIGLRPHLNKDAEYQSLNTKLSEQRARVNPKSASLINKYLELSYGLNSLAMLWKYFQKTVFKNIKDKPASLNHTVEGLRSQIDKFMFKLLANIQEEIEKSIDAGKQ